MSEPSAPSSSEPVAAAELLPTPESETERDLTRGALWKTVLGYGLPLFAAMVFYALFNIIDLLIVGRLSSAAVGAVYIGGTINTIPMVIYNGVSIASVALIAFEFGQNRLSKVSDLVNQSMSFCCLLGIIIGVGSWILSRPLVDLFGGTGGITEPAVDYLEILSLGTVAMFLLMQVTSVLRAIGDSRWTMYLLVGSNVLNIILDYLLVFGIGPFPRWEVAGAAIATVAARGLGAVVGLIVLWRARHSARLHLSKLWPLAGPIIVRLIRYGLPHSAQLVIRIVSILVVTRILSRFFGESAVSAFGVGFRLDTLALFAAVGWGSAIAPIMGQCLGAGQLSRALRATWMTVFFASIILAGLAVFYGTSAQWLIRLCIAEPEPEVLALGTAYLRISCLSYVFLAITVVLAYALNGARSMRIPLFIDALVCFGVQIPAAHLAARYGGTPQAVFWSLVGVHGVLAIIYLLVFLNGYWKSALLPPPSAAEGA